MKVSLKHNVSVFLRDGGNVGYIANRYNLNNCVYEGCGADFLNALDYEPQETEDIVDKKLIPLYGDASREELLADFNSFVRELETEGFADIDRKDKIFQQITVELTNGCNERCVHCYLPNIVKEENKALSKETIKRIIDDFAAHGGETVVFTGGEALLSPNVFLLKYAYGKGLNTSVLSNLTVLRDSHILLFSECNTSVQASLYSCLPAEQDAITLRKGSCVQTMNAIRKLREKNIPVRISCILMQENPYAYKGVIEFAKEVGANVQVSYHLQAQINGECNNLSHRIQPSKVKEILRDLLINYRDTMKPLPIFEKDSFVFEDWLHAPVCSACNDSIYINSSGGVQPCPSWTLELGNINKEPLSDILNTIESRSNFPITMEMFPQCLKCDARDFCSICLSFNAAEYRGKYMKLSSYICDHARLFKDVYNDLKGKGLI